MRLPLLILLLSTRTALAAPELLPGPAGSRILLLTDHTLPLVHLRVGLRTGAADVPAGQEGLAAFVVHLPFRGLRHANHRSPLDRLGDLGARPNLELDYQHLSYGLTVLERQLDAATAILAELLLRPELRLGEGELFDYARWSAMREDGVRAHLRERLAEEVEDAAGQAGRCLRHALYGDHPLGHSPFGSERALAALTLEDAARAYRRALTGGNVLFALAGPLDGPQAAALIARHFGRLPQGPPWSAAQRASAPPRLAGELQLLIIDLPKEERVAVALGQRAPLPGAPELPLLEVATAALDASFRRAGWPTPERPARAQVSDGVLQVDATAAPDQIVAVLDWLVHRHQVWGQGELSAEEVAHAGRRRAARLAFALETLSARLQRHLLHAALTGAPVERSEADTGALEINQYLQVRPRHLRICLAGDRARLLPLLQRSKRWAGRLGPTIP
jgi:predicted Zn-dependent peptidase